MKKEFRKAAILALNNPDITNKFIQDSIDEYAAIPDDQLLLDLKAANAQFKESNNRDLADQIDAMRVARAVRKAK